MMKTAKKPTRKQVKNEGTQSPPLTEKAPTKHQLKSEATRLALLEAAERIFARDGFERAQIDEIARESGRTRGAVYAQYKTKEQLFFALQEQRIETATHDIRAIMSTIDEADHKARLAAVREYYSGIQDSRAALLDVELKLYALRHPESAADWRSRYMSFYSSGNFAKAVGVKRGAGHSDLDNRVTALAAVKSGLILAMYFLPDHLTAEETRLILLELFDGLFPSSSIASQEPKPKSTKRPTARNAKT